MAERGWGLRIPALSIIKSMKIYMADMGFSVLSIFMIASLNGIVLETLVSF